MVDALVGPVLGGALFRFAVEELSHYGANSIQIPRRLQGMLADLESCALTHYRDAINRLGHELVAQPDRSA